jgi:hypothetical protein
MASQNHQLGWKALLGPSSCWLVKETKASAVKAVAIIKGESSKIKRAWVKRPFSGGRVVSQGHAPGLRQGEGPGPTKDDEASAHGGREGPTPSSLECQEHGRRQKNTAQRGEQAHSYIWDTRLDVVLANLLEVEVAIETGQPAKQSDEELCQGRVDVHEELALDILGREAPEAAKMAVSLGRVQCSTATTHPRQGNTYCTSSNTTLVGWYMRNRRTMAARTVTPSMTW